MELILISESKLKIMLTADDMEDYSISCECMSYGSKDTRKIFGKILEEAKEKTGFDSNTGQLYIEVYPCRNGGCEVYVSTFEDMCVEQRRSEKKNTAAKRKKENCIYGFEDIDSVIGACRILKCTGYGFESTLCRDMNGRKNYGYYLILQEEMAVNQGNRKRRILNKSDLANEYGKRIDRREIMYYIDEHTERMIEKNAVEVLSKY